MMKNVTRILALALCTLSFAELSAQSCHGNTEQFQALPNDESFAAMHPYPVSPVGIEIASEKQTIPTADGKSTTFHLWSAESNKYLIVIHEWWGLNQNILETAQHYYDQFGGELNIIAVDLYDGKVGETREEASKLMQGNQKERSQAILEAIIEYTGEDSGIGTMGRCFGGGWSLQAALLGEARMDACVIYYGMPVKGSENLEALNCPVLGVFASEDKWINGEVVKTFENDMEKAGKMLAAHTFEADHAFANPSNPRYNEEAAKTAEALTIEFLKVNLLKTE
jgi:carboxymethylenebutenolidase